MTPERVVFIGTTKQNPEPFMQGSGFKSAIDISQPDPEGKLFSLFVEYIAREDFENQNSEDKSSRLKPSTLLIEDNAQELLDAAKTFPFGVKGGKSTEFFQTLTIFRLGADTHSDIIDKDTGIRVVNIVKGESAFPMHPTPNS